MPKLAPEQYAVYLITDDPSRYSCDFVAQVERALEGGVTVVQYRDTQSSGRVLYERCLRLQKMLQVRGVPLIVNNDTALALAVGAAGVHVGQSDFPPEAVRRVAGDALDIGLSVRCVAEARAADVAFADAVGVGPVWDARGTKADAAEALGLEGLREVLAALPSTVATVAIGGITPERATALYTAGVNGVSAVSAFSKAEDPAAVARAFAACRKPSGARV